MPLVYIFGMPFVLCGLLVSSVGSVIYGFIVFNISIKNIKDFVDILIQSIQMIIQSIKMITNLFLQNEESAFDYELLKESFSSYIAELGPYVLTWLNFSAGCLLGASEQVSKRGVEN